jgi:hypothetical protein
MRSLSIVISLLLVSHSAFSQETHSGVIFGLLSDSVAHLVASAPIEARNATTGETFTIHSGATGEYRFTGLPAGDYEITVKIDGIGSFSQPRIGVTEARMLRFDIILPLP